MKIQDFHQITLSSSSSFPHIPPSFPRRRESIQNNLLEIITATLAFLLPAILLFLIAAK